MQEYILVIFDAPSFFLPWVLPGILVSWVFAGRGWWARAPGGRCWSSLATGERPWTARDGPGLASDEDAEVALLHVSGGQHDEAL